MRWSFEANPPPTHSLYLASIRASSPPSPLPCELMCHLSLSLSKALYTGRESGFDLPPQNYRAGVIVVLLYCTTLPGYTDKTHLATRPRASAPPQHERATEGMVFLLFPCPPAPPPPLCGDEGEKNDRGEAEAWWTDIWQWWVSNMLVHTYLPRYLYSTLPRPRRCGIARRRVLCMHGWIGIYIDRYLMETALALGLGS